MNLRILQPLVLMPIVYHRLLIRQEAGLKQTNDEEKKELLLLQQMKIVLELFRRQLALTEKPPKTLQRTLRL